MDSTGFLMMAHLDAPEGLAQQGELINAAGAQTVYITDSAGYMLPDDVTARVSALRAVLRPETEIGFHGHHNMGMGIANSIAAVAAGAGRIDASVAGLGAGAGNTPLEAFVAVCEAHGHRDGLRSLQAHGHGRGGDFADHGQHRPRQPLLADPGLCRRVFDLPAARQPRRRTLWHPGARHPGQTGRRNGSAARKSIIVNTAMTMAKERGLLKEIGA